MRTLGIYGLGQFGQFIASHLRDHFDIVAGSHADCSQRAQQLGIRSGSLADVAACDIVVPCVPVQYLGDVLTQMSTHLRPGALVVDVSSVKVIPVRLMLDILPANVQILATHPLFGPQSGKDGLAGLPIVVHAQRVEHPESIVEFFSSLGLEVILMDPEAHDRQMAIVQGLSHLISRALTDAGLDEVTLRTKAFDHLRQMHELLRHDTWELFVTLQNHNPYAHQVRERFVKQLGSVERALDDER